MKQRSVIQVRVSLEERKEIEEAAKREGRSLSKYVSYHTLNVVRSQAAACGISVLGPK